MLNVLFSYLLLGFQIGQSQPLFAIETRPRIINNEKIMVTVEVINNSGKTIHFLEGFLVQMSNNDSDYAEKRVVMIPMNSELLNPNHVKSKGILFQYSADKNVFYKFHISKLKFIDDYRIYSYHPDIGLIRID